MIKKNKFYIYHFFDPIKNGPFKYENLMFEEEPFYVGKGFDRRWQAHFKESNLKRDPNKHKVNKIKKLLGLGYKKEDFVKIFESGLSEEEAVSKEREHISKIGRNDLNLGPLTNMTDGGDGVSGRIYTQEQRKALSLRMKGEKHPNFRRIFSKEELENMSISHRLFEFKIISPQKEIFFSQGLRQFARDHNLNNSALYDVANGRYYSYKGWVVYKLGWENLRNEIEGLRSSNKRRKSSFKRNYKIISPIGELFNCDNLVEFCKNNDLNYVNFQKTALGEYFTYKNWICYIVGKEYLRDEIEKSTDVFSICSPDGIYYENIFSLAEFCREHRLIYHNIKSNYIKNRDYKGWVVFKHPFK